MLLIRSYIVYHVCPGIMGWFLNHYIIFPLCGCSLAQGRMLIPDQILPSWKFSVLNFPMLSQI